MYTYILMPIHTYIHINVNYHQFVVKHSITSPCSNCRYYTKTFIQLDGYK